MAKAELRKGNHKVTKEAQRREGAMRDAGFGMRDSGFRIQDSGFEMVDAGCWMRDFYVMERTPSYGKATTKELRRHEDTKVESGSRDIQMEGGWLLARSFFVVHSSSVARLVEHRTNHGGAETQSFTERKPMGATERWEAMEISMLDAGFKIQEAGFRIQDSRCSIQDAGFGMRLVGYAICDAGFRMLTWRLVFGLDLGSGILNLES